MSIEIVGQVGQQFLSDGASANIRQGRLAEMIISELQGRYYENAARGNTYFACNQAAIVATAGLRYTRARSSVRATSARRSLRRNSGAEESAPIRRRHGDSNPRATH